MTTEHDIIAMTQDEEISNGLKPQGLPDKFWNSEKSEIRIDALIKSYLELEKKLSNMIPAPDNDENRYNLLRTLGVPETPEQYSIDVSHGLFNPDTEVNTRLHAKGITPEQLQEVYDLAAEKMVPMIAEIAMDFQAEREVQKLVEYFGGEEKWQEVSRQLLAFGKRNLPEDVLDNLAGTYDGVLALYKMMKSNEPKMLKDGEATTAESEQELYAMMKSPKYWRDRDPSHVAKVTEGFQRMFR